MAAGRADDSRPESSAVRDRSWLDRSQALPDQELIERWRREVDDSHRPDARVGLAGDGAVLLPGISVVVPTFQGRGHIERCLMSLAGQTLDPSMFEIIAVLNGPDDGTREIVEQVRKAHPTVDVRTIRVHPAGVSRARNAGIAAARRQYTTFVDDDDYVSASFLQVLVDRADPRTVPVVPVIDTGPASENADTYINVRLAPRSGQVTPARDLPVATSFNAAKAVHTALARRIRYDVDLRSGEDVVFWTAVAVRGRVDFLPCPPAEGATYYRTVRDGSASRQEPTFDVEIDRRLEVITRLDGLVEEADASTVALVHDRIAQVTAFVNAYLHRHPDSRREVVSALDRRAIFHLPYERLNHGLARGLTVAYAFPPYVDTSAVVTAKRLRARGEAVDVVSNAMDRIRGTDPTLRRISGPLVARQARLATPSYFSAWSAMEAFAAEGLRAVEAWREADGSKRPYEWLYSRAQFPASHLLAAAYKLSHPDVRWVAEFSDPLSRDVLGNPRGSPVTGGKLCDTLRRGLRRRGLPAPHEDTALVWAEEIPYALADELVFTNEHQRDYMLSYCGHPDLARLVRDKAVVSPHPTLPSEFYSMVECDHPLEDGVAHIAYFGNFYANRGPDDLLSALASLDRGTRGRVRVHFFTAEPEDVARAAADRGVSDSVRVGPYLRYLEFLNLTTRLDALVVADAVTAGRHRHNPYLPSKWSDYRGSGRPVWGIVEEDSPLSRQSLDFVSPAGDASAGAEIITDIVRRALD